MSLRIERGWFGMFTREQAPGEGVIPNGASIAKATFEPGDATPIGTRGVVLGSIREEPYGILYFVEWSNRPRFAVGVRAGKVRPL